MRDVFNIGLDQMIYDNSQKECIECNKLKSNHELVTVIDQYICIRCWLKINNVPFDLLVLRPDKFKADSWPIADGNPATFDMRFMPDDILKKKMLDTFVDINDVFLVVDDRDKVVKMWRDLGLNTFQVAPGDF